MYGVIRGKERGRCHVKMSLVIMWKKRCHVQMSLVIMWKKRGGGGGVSQQKENKIK